MKTKKNSPSARSVILDFEGERWVVTKTRATKHGFTIERGLRESDVRNKERITSSIILTPALANYLRAHPKHKVGVSPISSYKLYTALVRRVCPPVTVTDIDGVGWVVRQTRPTPHGFAIEKGIRESDINAKKRIALSIILTPALADYLRANPMFKQGVSPIASFHYTALVRRVCPPVKVTDIDGVVWVVRKARSTAYGFEIALGVRESDIDIKKRNTSATILTPALADYLRANPMYKKGVSPISKSSLYRDLSMRVTPRSTVTDVDGVVWVVLEEKPSGQDFPLLYGTAYTDDVDHRAKALIPTPELIAFLKAHKAKKRPLHEIDLRLSNDALHSFTRRVKIDFMLSEVKGVDGVTYAVRSRAPTEHGFDLLMGRPLPATPDNRYVRVIPTKALLNYLRACPTPGDVNLPMIERSAYSRLLRRFRPLPKVKDVLGHVWLVQKERATKHGFTLFFGHKVGGVATEEGGGRTTLIPTRALVNYLKKYFESGGAITYVDLPIKTETVRKFTERLGIERTQYVGQKWLAAMYDPTAKYQPAAKEPAAKEPAVKKPAVKKPAVKKPAVKKPAAKKPAAKKPAAKKPAAKKPASKKR